MKYKWLNYKKNKELIVFFNGWGLDEGVISHLYPRNFDVLMFYDYNNLETDFDFFVFEKYSRKYLIAWSMGVMVATLFNIEYDYKVAINGTLKPIDNEYGIPVRIYDLTLKNYNPKGAQKFLKSMFNKNYKLPEIKRDFENQKSELAAIREYKSNLDFKYDKVLISDDDKIIPSKNQSNYWGIKPNLRSGHSPFNLYHNWSEILYG